MVMLGNSSSVDVVLLAVEDGTNDGLSTQVSIGVLAFRLRLATLPFLPFPLGIVASANFVRLGDFLVFLKCSINSGSI